MRLPLILILPVLIIGALIDLYLCRTVWHRCKRHSRFWKIIVLSSSLIFCILLVGLIVWPKSSSGDNELTNVMWILYFWLAIYLSKLIFIFFDLLSKIPQLWGKKRIKWLGRCGIIGLGCFGLMMWSAFINRYNIDVNEVEITNADIPAEFDGLKLIQLSDLHVGTFGNDTTFVENVVNTINSLHPDIVVFTGDIVNRRSSELGPFISALSKIEAPLGIFSILGNHDYGDYYRWASDSEKHQNLVDLHNMQQQAGWQLLNNQTAFITRNNDSIAIIGVENIGDPPFPAYGDLDLAYPGDLTDPTFKILLSHNPAHWRDDIQDAPDKNIALTLSGHTHAMQMELFGWSPAVWRYEQWGGLYADADSTHLLYVNIGLGEVAIPARIGATPELTLFTLRKL